MNIELNALRALEAFINGWGLEFVASMGSGGVQRYALERAEEAKGGRCLYEVIGLPTPCEVVSAHLEDRRGNILSNEGEFREILNKGAKFYVNLNFNFEGPMT